jgi:hypothetical protein
VMHRQHAGSAGAAVIGLERLAAICDLLRVRSIPFVVGLIGEQPYRSDEVAAFVGADAVVPVAVDAWAAAVLAGRAGSAVRFRRSALMQTLGELANVLSARLRQTRQELAWDPASFVGAPGNGADHG